MALPTQVSSNPLTPQSIKTAYKPKLLTRRDKILFAGDSTSGKTFAYLRMAQYKKELAEANGTRIPGFWVMDTNNALPAFLEPGADFDFLYYMEDGGNVYPFPVSNWTEAIQAAKYIQDNAQEGDYVVIDVLSQLYDFAQLRVAADKGINVTEETFKRLGKEGFGPFGSDEWQKVKILFQDLVNGLYYASKTNMLMTAHIQDIVDVAGRNKRESMLMFDDFGLKPRGPEWLVTVPETIVMMWGLREVKRDDRGRRMSAKTVRYMQVVKDRGNNYSGKRPFDKDVFLELEAWRTEDRAKRREGMSFNIVKAEEVAAAEEARQLDLSAESPEVDETAAEIAAASPEPVEPGE